MIALFVAIASLLIDFKAFGLLALEKPRRTLNVPSFTGFSHPISSCFEFYLVLPSFRPVLGGQQDDHSGKERKRVPHWSALLLRLVPSMALASTFRSRFFFVVGTDEYGRPPYAKRRLICIRDRWPWRRRRRSTLSGRYRSRYLSTVASKDGPVTGFSFLVSLVVFIEFSVNIFFKNFHRAVVRAFPRCPFVFVFPLFERWIFDVVWLDSIVDFVWSSTRKERFLLANFGFTFSIDFLRLFLFESIWGRLNYDYD